MVYEFGFEELKPIRRARGKRRKGGRRRGGSPFRLSGRGSKPIGRGLGRKPLRRAWRKLL